MTTRSHAAGIPRLQDVEFLAIAGREVGQGGTYDDVRRALIDYMASERERTQPTGNHAALRLARHDEHRYMSNATDALAELMRLDLVEPAQLPTTRKAAPVYARRTFSLTDEGEEWVRLLESDARSAYDQLLVGLWDRHPQLSGFLRTLQRGTFTIPVANWRDAHPDGPAWPEGREAYVRFLAARAASAVDSGVTGWTATEDEIAAAIHDYINQRLESDVRRHRPDRFPRSRDFVGACEEAIVSLAFSKADVKMDYITLEITRRWTKQLGVANFSYHVPAAPALRLWATADLGLDDEGGLVSIQRRTVPEWGDRVVEELPAAYDLTRKREGRDDSFVPIFRVRAAVCSKLGLGDAVFDRAVEEFLAGKRLPEFGYRMHADSSEYGNTPPSETPLVVQDHSGRPRTYRVMTMIHG